MRSYVVVVEQAEGNFSAYSPDLPGCVATGATVNETMKNMVEAIQFHQEGCRDSQPTIQESRAVSTTLVFA